MNSFGRICPWGKNDMVVFVCPCRIRGGSFCWVFVHSNPRARVPCLWFARFNYAVAFSRSRSLCRPILAHSILCRSSCASWPAILGPRPGCLPSRPHKSLTFLLLDLSVSSLHQLRWDAISVSEPTSHEATSGKYCKTYIHIHIHINIFKTQLALDG